MKTGCFNTYKGDRGVAICLYSPAWWSGPNYRCLNPPLKTFLDVKSGRISKSEYASQYKKLVLDILDPFKVIKDLEDRVLLCWELPVFDLNRNVINKGRGFCHRHLVSDWILDKTGVVVNEYDKNLLNKGGIKLF